LDIWTQFWNWPLSTMETWRHVLESYSPPDAPSPAPPWLTPNRLQLELPALRLWDFSCGDATTPVAIVTPYALHDGGLVDLAPGHSLVNSLLLAGRRRLFVAEWKSATTATRNHGIDDLLATLNVAVDEIGTPVDLIGLCQGGWLSLLFAVRFAEKVRRVVIAGAPIDIEAEPSVLTEPTGKASDDDIQRLIELGDGRVEGKRMARLWPREETRERRLCESLQIEAPFDEDAALKAINAFNEWDARALDLPGPYYREVITLLYRENRLAKGRFPALGRLIDLRALRQPLFVLVGDQDVVAPPAQALAAARLVGGPVATAHAPCGHLALFLGRRTLANEWPRIAHWLSAEETSTQERPVGPVHGIATI
jgi:polyhydroxyalkanoate synthase subunit PhaC